MGPSLDKLKGVLKLCPHPPFLPFHPIKIYNFMPAKAPSQLLLLNKSKKKRKKDEILLIVCKSRSNETVSPRFAGFFETILYPV